MNKLALCLLMGIMMLGILLIGCPCEMNEQISPTCIVTDALVEIKIPIEMADTYTYYKDETQDNYLEYGIIIALGEYEFGYYLFKFGGYEEQVGSIQQLINAGQKSIFQDNGETFSIVSGHTVILTPLNPYVMISFDNTNTIDLLFDGSPATCTFTIKGFNAENLNGVIDIKYQ